MTKYKSNPICIQASVALAYLTFLLAPRLADSRVTFTGKVIAVADGDTLTVLHDKTPVKIRLHGVDAPEKAQPFGEKAKQLTSELVFGKEVRVEVVTRDSRTVGCVYTVNPPACLEEELVKAGLAWWYRQYAPKDKKLAQLEEEAKKAKRGLWADPNPMPPWEWRHDGKVAPTEVSCQKDTDCVLDYSVTLTDPSDPCSCSRCGQHFPKAVNKAVAPKPSSKPCTPRPCPACVVQPPPPLKAVCQSGRCSTSEVKPQAALGLFHGNAKSKVLHAPGCRDYGCKSCTAGFKTVDEAKKAGYRPHQVCVAVFEKCYSGCLRQNQAKAVAWEMIETDCRRSCAQ